MEKHSTNEMKDLLLSSVDIDHDIHHQLLFCYNSIVTSNWFLDGFFLFHRTIMETMRIKQKNVILTKKSMTDMIFKNEILDGKFYSELLKNELSKLKEIRSAYYI